MSLTKTISSVRISIAGILIANLMLAVLACVAPPTALAGPAEEHGLFKFGEGTFKWFFIPIFTAQLWSNSEASLADLYEQPVMLSIKYDWNISRKRFLQATREEWRRLDGKLDAREIEWLERLAGIYPDIKSGERLTSLVIPDGGTRFYLGDKEIGWVDDAEFGRAFLAIWLDQNTRDTRLREGLLKNFPAIRDMQALANIPLLSTAMPGSNLPAARAI